MITSYDELYHYGVLGMRWGVRHDKQRAYKRAKKKLSKIDSKVQKKRSMANESYQKGQKKMKGLFANEKKARKFFENSSQLQREVLRLEGKGSKWIESMKSIFSKAGLEIDADVLKLGEQYLSSINQATNQLYSMALYNEYWGKKG